MNWNGDSIGKKPNPLDGFINNLLNKPGGLINIILILVVLGAGLTSFYTVEPEEEAVLTRFGAYKSVNPPGLHFKIPFGIDRVVKLKTKAVLQEAFGFYLGGAPRRARYSRNLAEESLMVTGDLNVADVQWVVQYQIADPVQFLFNVRDPQKNIRDISQAVMRRAVGDRTVNDVLTVGRNLIESDALVLMQGILDEYKMGVRIVDVKLQDVNPPKPVQPSFNEVNAAKQEQEKAINRAEAYYNQKVPEARGKADQEISRAKGYAAALLNRSKGDADKFLAILGEYQKAPQVTRSRLYLELIEDVMGRTESITIVDPNIKGVLPLYEGSATGLRARLKPPTQNTGGQ